MSHNLIFIISESILLPLLAGLIRLRRLGEMYQPFFLFILTGCLAEIISFIVMEMLRNKNAVPSNAVPSNILVLIEWLLIAWQFHAWGFLRQNKKAFYAVLFLPVLVWVIENLVLGKITIFSPYFRFLYSALIVLLSVNKINFMITHDNRNLFRNPSFLICISLIIFYIYKILYEWAYQVSLVNKATLSSSDITSRIIFFMAYINALTNIIYAIAFLLIPARVKFTLK